MNTPVNIRWMIRRDMPSVLDIEARAFDRHAWDESDFIRCLRQRNAIGMVAEKADRVVGHMIYELHRTKLHVLNFAVDSDYRRQRVGTQLFAKLVSKLTASPERRHKIVLEVRETNLEAQLFFRAMGMRAVSVERDFYEGYPREDAYLMEFRCSEQKKARIA